MKKADIIDDETCETTGAQYCSDCPDYDTCDNCGRRVCKYVSVIVADNEKEYKEDEFVGELWCRYCCREAGFSTSEIESGRVYL
jgi:MinD superfamily P-loop ATPase